MSDSELVETHERSVTVVRAGQRRQRMLRWVYFRDQTYRIDIEAPGGVIRAAAHDLFAALQQVRLVLEERGWLAAVQGARKDAYPSGMLRDMVGARRVYILHLGKDMDRNDLVDTFAEADSQLVATVDEQNRFYRTWRTSVTR